MLVVGRSPQFLTKRTSPWGSMASPGASNLASGFDAVKGVPARAILLACFPLTLAHGRKRSFQLVDVESISLELFYFGAIIFQGAGILICVWPRAEGQLSGKSVTCPAMPRTGWGSPSHWGELMVKPTWL